MKSTSKSIAPRQQAGAGELVVALTGVTLHGGERQAFRRLHWTFRAGEQWAMLGPNGSGKSLLARAIAGDVMPVRGEIHYGWDAHPDEPRGAPAKAHGAQSVALVSPHMHRSLAERESSYYQSRWHSGVMEGLMTVGRYLSQDQVEEINPFEVRPHRQPRRAFLRRRAKILALLGLAPLWRRKLTHLSSGEMRKVLLAHALLKAPRLLVLDDPFAGLDAPTRQRLRRVLGRLGRQDLHVLVATGRPDELPAHTTHLLLVDGHRIIAQGPIHSVLRHPVVRRLKTAAAAAFTAKAAPGRRAPRTGAARLLVEMNRVTVRSGGKTLLAGIDWQLRQGEHWALLGHNGAGKTTFLSLIQGDHPQVYAQDIRLFGRSPDSTQGLWEARQQMGWMSPELHLHYPLQWVCEDVVCSGFFDSMGLHQACSARQRRQARRWLQRLGLGSVSDTSLGELSLGDQRLVMLARAAVKRPRLLVLDEPCQGIDLHHRRLLLQSVDTLVADAGASLIFVTHHQSEMPRCITHQLRLRQGRIVAHGLLE